jgi:hypothetical protein
MFKLYSPIKGSPTIDMLSVSTMTWLILPPSDKSLPFLLQETPVVWMLLEVLQTNITVSPISA